MKKILLALALVAGLAHATDPRVRRMHDNCIEVMDSGACRIALDPKDYPNETIPVILPSGRRDIKTKLYLAIRATGFQKDARGRWLMCKKVLVDCANWDSDECIAVRTMGWRY